MRHVGGEHLAVVVELQLADALGALAAALERQRDGHGLARGDAHVVGRLLGVAVVHVEFLVVVDAQAELAAVAVARALVAQLHLHLAHGPRRLQQLPHQRLVAVQIAERALGLVLVAAVVQVQVGDEVVAVAAVDDLQLNRLQNRRLQLDL